MYNYALYIYIYIYVYNIGDVIEPSGTLTGGAQNTVSESVLKLLMQLNQLENDFNNIQQQLNNVNIELAHNHHIVSDYRYLCMYIFYMNVAILQTFE